MATRSLPVQRLVEGVQQNCKLLASAMTIQSNTDLFQNFNTRVTPSFSYTLTRSWSESFSCSPAAIAAISSKMSMSEFNLPKRRTPEYTCVLQQHSHRQADHNLSAVPHSTQAAIQGPVLSHQVSALARFCLVVEGKWI
jgi:hypothetical protein